jgi:hypothetical protein
MPAVAESQDVLRELEAWLHVRERLAAIRDARTPGQDWRRRRVAILRHSRAIMAALRRGIEL